MSTITIAGIGPIDTLDIPVPENGGVVVLRGRNGSGKTTALRAVESLVTKSAPPSVGDGVQKGVVEGLGVKLSVGRSSRRTGALEVGSVEGLSLSKLVDPGIKDPQSADAARIKQLIGLIGVRAETGLFESVVSADELAAVLPPSQRDTTDLVELTGRIKRGLESQAREFEARAATYQAEAVGFEAAAGDASPVAEVADRSALQKAFEASVREQERLDRLASERIDVLRQRGEIAADLIDCDIDSDIVEQAKNEASRRRSIVEHLDRRIREAEEALDAFRRERVDAAHLFREASTAFTALEEKAQRQSSLQQRLDALVIPEEVTPEIFAEAASRVAETRAAVENAAVLAKRITDAKEAMVRRNKASSARHHAEQKRAKATACEDVLADVIARSGVPLRVRIQDGETRLVIHHAARGRDVPYAELSHGERYRLAIDIAVAHCPQNGLFTIEQEAWEGLDSVNRNTVQKLATEKGVVILTAAAGDETDVVAEVFG